jgi:hypothetical protein
MRPSKLAASSDSVLGSGTLLSREKVKVAGDPSQYAVPLFAVRPNTKIMPDAVDENGALGGE